MKNKGDSELGEFIATATIGNKTTIKQYKFGFSVKKNGELITEKFKREQETTPKDMADMMVKYAVFKQ